MNNKVLKSNFVLFITILALAIFIALVVFIGKTSYEGFMSAQDQFKQSQIELDQAQREVDESKATLQKEEDLLRSIKSIYNAEAPSSNDNLSAFGTMFDDVIQRIQQNGLMIRAIEYKMNPEGDAVFANFGKDYNVCTLKFFLVGTYAQLKTLLNELNGNFPYLLGVSKTNVLVYKENTDYILADLSVTLYSKKANK